MTDNLEKLAAKSESVTDNILTRLVAFPYSWIVALIVLGFAIKGVISVL
jgi:hypothetical protein